MTLPNYTEDCLDFLEWLGERLTREKDQSGYQRTHAVTVTYVLFCDLCHALGCSVKENKITVLVIVTGKSRQSSV